MSRSTSVFDFASVSNVTMLKTVAMFALPAFSLSIRGWDGGQSRQLDREYISLTDLVVQIEIGVESGLVCGHEW